MNLKELLEDTDALTYINALKVTLTEIKDELANQEELTEYLSQSRERTRKLVRKADNQYRLIAKIVTKDAVSLTSVTVSDEDYEDDIKSLMEE